MTEAADLILRNAEVHPRPGAEGEGDPVAGAVAVRDGRVVGVGREYDVGFLEGVETAVLDLGGRVLLPGFVDAHTHLSAVGRRAVHADLGGAGGVDGVVDALRAADDGTGWVLGFGFDESEWGGPAPTGADLEAVSADRPVVAVREDMHSAVVNGAALDALGLGAGHPGVETADGTPTGRIFESGVEAVFDAVEPDVEGMREYLRAAQRVAHRRGVTAVHDMVRRSTAPAAYRELALADELRLRVRLNYWADHLDALVETGLRTNHGGEFVRVGAVKTLTDGSLGSHTARLADPYADAQGRGEWVVSPAELADVVERADGAGFQVAVHAIGDEAVGAALDALAAVEDGDETPTRNRERRHRVEHAELATDDHLDRAAALGVCLSMQPNFHRWAGPGGLYETRLGAERAARTNRLGAVADAGVPLAFGSDCMPLDPLAGVHHAVNAPTDAQSLSVGAALAAYTRGAAYAGFDEDRMGTIERGALADLVALERSPWEHPAAIADVGVALTVVDGDVVHDAR